MSEITIPSLPDLMRGIERWMESQATGDEPTTELHAEVERIVDMEGVSADHLFTLLSFASGCHCVAEERRLRSDYANGIVFHYFGQIMLSKAVEVFANLAVSEMRRVGERLH